MPAVFGEESLSNPESGLSLEIGPSAQNQFYGGGTSGNGFDIDLDMVLVMTGIRSLNADMILIASDANV